MTTDIAQLTLPEWLEYLESLHPEEIELGLQRISQVATKLPIDFSEQKVVCVGGTNGKGSTVNLLAGILQEANYSVGCYTSPHLIHYNERIRINNAPVSDKDLCNAFSQVEKARQDTQLTYFEFGTLAAMLLFSQHDLDYVVLEVGLGGRLDAVNIVDADLSILTNVAMDHTDWLGDSIEAIGKEKAGIFRSGRPAIFGEDAIPSTVLEISQTIGAQLHCKGKQFNWHYNEQDSNFWCWQGLNNQGQKIEFENLPSSGFPLDYSLNNVAIAIQAISLLDSSISQETITKGLYRASLAGRFQQINRQDYALVLDVAHNPHAATKLCQNMLQSYPNKTIHIVIAMLQDKDIPSVLKLLKPLKAHWHISTIKEYRGSEAEILYNHLQDLGETNLHCYDTIDQAFVGAEKEAKLTNEVVLVTGSFFTVSAVLELI